MDLKKKHLGIVIGLIGLIILLLLPWIFMIESTIKINMNKDDYEIVEADIIEVRVVKSDDVRAAVGYNYNGMSCYTDVTYYDKEDSGKKTIQIAINKKTGTVSRMGFSFSYGSISKIFVIICLALLIFAKIREDKINVT